MSARSLPRIRFQTAARPVDRVLPRMDVAGFVGFAKSGPVDVPVPIENTGQFTAIFGDDLQLDDGAGGRRRAFLGAAVRAFFGNGGQRCLVVRVTCSAAQTVRFRWQRFDRGQEVGADLARPSLGLEARSAGSWASALTVVVLPRSRRVPCQALRLEARRDGVFLHGETQDGRIAVADALRVRSAGGHAVGPVVELAPPATTRAFVVGPLRVPEGNTWRALTAVDELPGVDVVEVCTLALAVVAFGRTIAEVSDLGYVPGHARWFGDLPDDRSLWSSQRPLTPFQREVADPRFPLAAPADPRGQREFWPRADDRVWVEAPESTVLPIVGDGMAAFDAAAFLDPEHGHGDLATLLAASELVERSPRDPGLRGVHALWSSEEVTILALPDLVQLPWRMDSAISTVRQTPVVEDPTFQPCGAGLTRRPSWRAPKPGREFVLRWQPVRVAGVRYRLEWVADRGQAPSATDLAQVTATVTAKARFRLSPTIPLAAVFRVRAELGDDHGPWSPWLAVQQPTPSRLRSLPSAEAQANARQVVAVQHAVLRLCALRSDLVAVLAPPAGDATVAAMHLEQLVSRASLPAWERRLLGHGGLYGPWLLVREAEGELRAVPPEGAITGTLAQIAKTGGAWLAAANMPLRGILAPASDLGDAVAEQWAVRRGNPIRREVIGTVASGQWTLADADDEVQHLHVRRLLGLLRRLALRWGQQQVFEPIGPAFERALAARFDSVLQELFARGAFAGDRPSQAYQIAVHTDSDRGRVQVELRVAPSMPLRFLTVRLVLDDAGIAMEGS